VTSPGPNGLTYGAGYSRVELEYLGRAAWRALTGKSAPKAPISASDRLRDPLGLALSGYGTDGPAVRALAARLRVSPSSVYRWKRTGRISDAARAKVQGEARRQHTARVRARRRVLLSRKREAQLRARWLARGASDRGTLSGRVRKSDDEGDRKLFLGRWGSPYCQLLLDVLITEFLAGASIQELGDVIATAIDSEMNEEHAFIILGDMTLDL
jgi:hypothetical protein